METDTLLAAWEQAARSAGASGPVGSAGRDLLARWAEAHRAYHDLRHLAEVLDRIDELAVHADLPDVVRLAAWFHDAVYDPKRTDNEERSTALARMLLDGLAVSPEAVTQTCRLVLLTRTHAVEPGDADGAVLCDADLAVLAASRARYDEYAADVRREYAHLPDEAFAAGRADVLRRLLATEPLFRTPTASTWEEAARANLRRELGALTAAARAARSG